MTLIVDVPPGAHYPPEITADGLLDLCERGFFSRVASETTVTVLDDNNGLTFEMHDRRTAARRSLGPPA